MSGLPQSRLPQRPAPRHRGEQAPVRLILGIGLLALALLVLGTVSRLLRRRQINQTAHETAVAVPVVRVVTPWSRTRRGGGSRSLLPITACTSSPS